PQAKRSVSAGGEVVIERDDGRGRCCGPGAADQHDGRAALKDQILARLRRPEILAEDAARLAESLWRGPERKGARCGSHTGGVRCTRLAGSDRKPQTAASDQVGRSRWAAHRGAIVALVCSISSQELHGELSCTERINIGIGGQAANRVPTASPHSHRDSDFAEGSKRQGLSQEAL